MNTIKSIFESHKAEKNTMHYCSAVYDKIFNFERREEVRTLLEIGISDGGSLLAFKEAFPNAEIFGLDCEDCNNQKVGSDNDKLVTGHPRPERIRIYQGDMRVEFELLNPTRKRLFDVIIDDTTHSLDDNLRTLFWLYPHLKVGGIYIIEGFAHDRADMMGILETSISLFCGARLEVTDADTPYEYILVIEKENEHI